MNGSKSRLQTNLDVHLDHVRESGVVDAIRVMKILRDRYVQNRLTPAEQSRLLDRPEVIRSLGDDMIDEARRANDLG